MFYRENNYHSHNFLRINLKFNLLLKRVGVCGVVSAYASMSLPRAATAALWVSASVINRTEY